MKYHRKHWFITGLILFPLIIYLLIQHFSTAVLMDEKAKPEIDDRALLLFKSTDFHNTRTSMKVLEQKGGKVEHVFPPRVVIASVPRTIDKKDLKDDNLVDLFRTRIDRGRLGEIDDSGRMAVSVWNRQFESQSTTNEPTGKSAGKDAGEQAEPGPIQNDLRYMYLIPGQVPVENEEQPKEREREGAPGSPVAGDKSVSVLPAPYPPQFEKTSEYMIGSVAVGIVLPESMGTGQNNTENWSAEREQKVIDQLILNPPLNTTNRKDKVGGFQWWIERDAEAGGKAKLSFIYDRQLRVPTSYEPINTFSTDHNGDGIYDEGLWIQEIMDNLSKPPPQGKGLGFTTTPPAGYCPADRTHPAYASCPYGYAVISYNNYLRDKYGTDWAVTIFIVDSLNDPDGLFPDGYFAYTYAGGPFTVMTYDNQKYGIDYMNAVMAHELGHDFYALDQYPPCSRTARSGFLQVENSNCEVNNPNAVASIMRGQFSPFQQGALDYWAKGQIGWWDVNNNGIYDPVDTIPVVSLDQCQEACLTQKQLEIADLTPIFSGVARDSQARIADVLFRIDNGAWNKASPADGQFNSSIEDFRFQLPLQTLGLHLLEVKAVNNFTGQTAPPYGLNLNILPPQPDVVRVIAVTIQAPEGSIPAGRIMQFSAAGWLNNGNLVTLDSGLTWNSSNNQVAGIDPAGLLLGLAPGSTVITARWAGPEGEQIESNSLLVAVGPYIPVKLALKSGLVITSGSQVSISVSGGGDNLRAGVTGPAFPDFTILSIDNRQISVRIPSTGIFAGKYSITVEDQKIAGQKVSLDFKVPLKIIPQVGNLPVGVDLTFQALGRPGPFTWITNDNPPGIAGIGSNSGIFSSSGVGTATISAADKADPEINGTLDRVFLIETGSVLVKVMDSQDGSPVAGAGIDIQNMAGLLIQPTEADGTSLIERLPFQPLILDVFAPGYAAQRNILAFRSAPGSGNPYRVEVRLEKAGLSLAGSVFNIAGLGVEKARVNVNGNLPDNSTYSASALTDGLGAFSIGIPDGGNFILSASTLNYGNSFSVALTNVAKSVQNISLVLNPYIHSEEDPDTRRTTSTILDLSGALDATNTTVSGASGSQPGGTFGSLSPANAPLLAGTKIASALAFIYTPGGQDANGDVIIARIRSDDLPAPGYLDYSFTVYPTQSQVARASTQQTVNGRAGGLITLGDSNAYNDRNIGMMNETSLFLPPKALPSDQDVNMRIVRFQGLEGTTWAKYSIEAFDVSGKPVFPQTAPFLPLREVPEEKRFILTLQTDPAIFDLKAFQNGLLQVQYQESPGAPFKSDDTFSSFVIGSSVIIESSHLSTWALNPVVPSQSESVKVSNGSGGGGGGGGGCFIASAAFVINNSFVRPGARLTLYPGIGFSWLLVYSGSFWARLIVPGLVASFLIPLVVRKVSRER